MSMAGLLVVALVVVVGMVLVVDGIARSLLARRDARSTKSAGEASAAVPAADVELSILAQEPAGNRIVRYAQLLLQRADLSLSLEALAGAIAAATLIMAVPLFIAVPGLPIWTKLILALAGGLLALFGYLRVRGRRRIEKFLEMFPDALDLIVRSLRIGHPLSVAINTVGSEMPDPIGKEFKIAARQISYGMSPPQAVDALARRMDVNDVRFFAVTVQIQYESGGNLSEILESLSAIIRARFQMFRRVRALTAEGRFSAWFLSLLPVAMIFIINTINPGYYESVSDFEYYPYLVVITLLMLLLNAVLTQWITKLKV